MAVNIEKSEIKLTTCYSAPPPQSFLDKYTSARPDRPLVQIGRLPDAVARER